MSTQAPDHRVAAAALDRFGLAADAQIEFVKQRENTVFRITDPSGAYAMRIHRHGHRQDAEIRSEILLMERLYEAALPISEVIRTVTGEPFATVPDQHGNQLQIDVQRWVADSAHFDDSTLTWQGAGETTPADFTDFGRLCGQFHRVSAGMGPIEGYQRDAWDLDGLVGAAPLWGAPERLATEPQQARTILEARGFIADRLAELGTDEQYYGVIHADFTPENVLRSPAGLTLIDFDDFGEGWWAFDLATTLFWYSQHPSYEEFKLALLTGYQEFFPMPQPALCALDALIVARGMTYLGWAADRPADETSLFIRDQVLPAVEQMADTLISTGRIRKAQ